MDSVPWGGNEPLAPLSTSQLELYVDFVSSGAFTLSSIQEALLLPTGPLSVLRTLIRCHTARIPWGSLANHYSPMAMNSLKAQDVFEKLVVRRLGGHCLEIVPLFAAVLRALGYSFYMTGARVGPAMTGEASGGIGVGFHGWSHLILIVTIHGQKYVVDPQYRQITEPVLLDPNGPEIVFDSIPNSVMRLRYVPSSEVVPNNASTSGLKIWLFEMKFSREDEHWRYAYIFSTDTEWFLEDLNIMNVWLAKAEDSYLLSQLMVTRVLLASEGGFDGEKQQVDKITAIGSRGKLQEPEVAGHLQLIHDRLTVWRFGQRVIDQKVTTEQERLEVMKEWFGIELQEEEVKAILSRPTALPS